MSNYSANSTHKTVRRFGFRQTIRGTLIVAIISGLMMGAYGTVIVKAYPTEQSRQALVQTLSATPAINFLSGEVKNAGTPASYGIYKSLPMLMIVTAVWGLMVSTRLLRGNEEDGRLELLASGRVNRTELSSQMLAGFGIAILVGIIVMWVITAALGAAPDVNLSPAAAFYMTLAVFLPGLVFAGLGALTSQLTLTRGRAVFYGLVPLIVLYCVRGVANISDDLDWLKKLSPFGWGDLTDSVLDPHPVWIIPALIFAGLLTFIGLYLVRSRDYGASLLYQRDEVRSRFYLLRSPLVFVVRQKRWAFWWWLVATLAMASFMTALAGIVSELLHDDKSSLSSLVAAITPEKIKLLFVGQSFMMIGVILLAMIIIEMLSTRREEARSYLDNLLVRQVLRRTWLLQRLIVTTAMALIITAVSSLAVWWIAHIQQIGFGLSDALASAAGVMAGVVLVLGVGAFLYGIWPRLTGIGMTIVVGWAFVVDILRSIFRLPDWVEKTSVLYYIPTDPAQSVHWNSIVYLVIIGLILSAIGIMLFTRRDIEGE